MKPNKFELMLIAAISALAALLLTGCDSYARATAAPVFNVTVTPAPAEPPAPVVIVDVAPVQGVTNLFGPPSDRDVPFNGDDETIESPCEKSNGRGQGIGRGNGPKCDKTKDKSNKIGGAR